MSATRELEVSSYREYGDTTWTIAFYTLAEAAAAST
jgi:hypothetical protein